MHDFLPAGEAIPGATAMISVPVVMFIPSEGSTQNLRHLMQSLNIKPDQIK